METVATPAKRAVGAARLSRGRSHTRGGHPKAGSRCDIRWGSLAGAKHRASIVSTIRFMALEASRTRRACFAAMSAAIGGTICGMDVSSALFRLGITVMAACTAVACTLLLPSDSRLYKLSAISLALMSAKPLEASVNLAMSRSAWSRAFQSVTPCTREPQPYTATHSHSAT